MFALESMKPTSLRPVSQAITQFPIRIPMFALESMKLTSSRPVSQAIMQFLIHRTRMFALESMKPSSLRPVSQAITQFPIHRTRMFALENSTTRPTSSRPVSKLTGKPQLRTRTRMFTLERNSTTRQTSSRPVNPNNLPKLYSAVEQENISITSVYTARIARE